MNLEPGIQSEVSSLPFKPGRPDAPGSPGTPLRPCEPFKAIQKSVFLLSTQDLPSSLPPPFTEPLGKPNPPYDPATPLLGIFPKKTIIEKDMYPSVLCSTI